MTDFNEKVYNICQLLTKIKGAIGKYWVRLPFLQKKDCAKKNKERMKNNKNLHKESDTMYLYDGIIRNGIPQYIYSGQKEHRYMNEAIAHKKTGCPKRGGIQ